MTEDSELFLDEYYTNFKEAFEKGVFSMDCTKYIEEIKTSTKVRAFRNIRSAELIEDTTKLIEATLDNQSRRTRIVEIKLQAQSIYNRIIHRTDYITNYLRVKYNKVLKSYASTQAERDMYMKELFAFTGDTIINMQNLILYCDTTLMDIDKTAWSLTTTKDCLEIISNDRRNNV